MQMTRPEVIEALRPHVPHRKFKGIVRYRTPVLKSMLMYYLSGGEHSDLRFGKQKRKHLPVLNVATEELGVTPVMMGFAMEDILAGDAVSTVVDGNWGGALVLNASNADGSQFRDLDGAAKLSEREARRHGKTNSEDPNVAVVGGVEYVFVDETKKKSPWSALWPYLFFTAVFAFFVYFLINHV